MKLSDIPECYHRDVIQEAKDQGFDHIDHFLDLGAGIARIHQLLEQGCFDGYGTHDEWLAFNATMEHALQSPSKVMSDHDMHYYLYHDQSLFVVTSAWCEVWAYVEDFLALIADTEDLDSATAALVAHIGRELA
jgi:hypothetical protein